MALVLAACGGGSSGAGGGAAPQGGAGPTVVTGSNTGILTDAAIQGVSYRTSSGVTGITGANGAYQFNPGDTVVFTLGGLTLGSVTATGIITPIDLAGGDAIRLQNLLVLVQSLDADGNPGNGIAIPAAAAAAVTASVNLGAATATFASSANTALQAAMTAGGISTPIKTAAEANAHFLSQGLGLLSTNIWTMVDGTTMIAIRIAANGEYLMGEADKDSYSGYQEGSCQADGSGCIPVESASLISTAGHEYGNLALPSFNQYGYSFTAAIAAGDDTNLQSGFSHPQVCDRVKPSGESIQFGGCPDGGLARKMDNDPAGIVGAWAQSQAVADRAHPLKTRHFLFFANGQFLVIDPVSDVKGVESGAYSYSNGSIVITRIDIDKNGNSGFGNGATPPVRRAESFGFVLSADGGSATFTNPAATPTTSTLTRVSK